MDPTADVAAKPDLRDYLAPILRYKWLILALAVVVALSTYAYYSSKAKTYQVSTDIYLKTSGADSLVTDTEQEITERELATQARVLQSRPVALRAARQAGFNGTAEELLDSVQVAVDPEADFITVAAESTTPQRAAKLANALAEAFLDQRLATGRGDADRALAAARKTLAELELAGDARAVERQELAARISQLEILRSLQSGDAVQLDRARSAAASSAPQPKRNAIFAFALSLVFGIIAAYGIDRLDSRIRHLQYVTPSYDAPVIATIPRAAERLANTPQTTIPSSLVESFRTLRTWLEVAVRDTEIKTLLITSAVQGEGKSTTVRNLALAYREAGKRVVIVEADLRRPTLGQWLSTATEPGLTDVLGGDARLSEALHDVPWGGGTPMESPSSLSGIAKLNGSGADTRIGSYYRIDTTTDLSLDDLVLLPGGSPVPDPPSLLGARDFKVLLDELKESFDIVIIDSPPLLTVSDTLPMLGEADGTLLVSRVGTTTEESAKQVAQVVDSVGGTRLLGVVANDVQTASLRAGYTLSEYAQTG